MEYVAGISLGIIAIIQALPCMVVALVIIGYTWLVARANPRKPEGGAP